MPENRHNWTKRMTAACLVAGACCACAGAVQGGSVTLKNGFEIPGIPQNVSALDPYRQKQAGEITSYIITMVDDGMRRYFVPHRRVDVKNADADLSRYDKFELEQERSSSVKALQQIGRALEETEWDAYGRRRIKLQTQLGPQDIFQVITELGPKRVQVRALNLNWEFGLSTTSIPAPQLDAMLRQATDKNDLKDRLAIARFYLQAEMYGQAQAEMESIIRDFPSAAGQVAQFSLELRALLGDQLLLELRRRKAAGQHHLAFEAARQFPSEQMSSAVLREVEELQQQHRQDQQRIELALVLLGDLQAGVDDPEVVRAVAPLRSAINEQLDLESLPRLDAFLNLSQDDTLSAEEKLGLAYSGWVVGSAYAVADLPLAIRLWEARFHVMEYLRTEHPELRLRTVDRLMEIEGISAERVRQLLRLLPPVLESPNASPGIATPVQVTREGAEVPVTYSVLLPHEYNPHHSYPLIIALRDAGQTVERELTWWGGTAESPGQSQRHGYIVIAPEYAESSQREYQNQAQAHYVILESFRDAKLRFNIDADRVFLAGHGMGGDAVFDLGMSHPDLFAGAISITGQIRSPCQYYRDNAENLAWYVVGGERDRDTFAQNMSVLNRMLTSGYDLIYAEYMQRGYESYYEEIHRLFEWMSRHRRTPVPKKFQMETMRPFDNRFYWMTIEGFPDKFKTGRMTRPMVVRANVNEANKVEVRSSFAQTTTLWFSRENLNFDERVSVYVNSRPKFNGFVKDDIEAILEDFWLRGDRQRMYSVKMVF